MVRKISKVIENEFIPEEEFPPPVEPVEETVDVSHSEEHNEEWSPEEEESFNDLVRIYIEVILKQHDKNIVKELNKENKEWKALVEEQLHLSNYKIRKIVKDNKEEGVDKIVEKLLYEDDVSHIEDFDSKSNPEPSE